MRAVLRVVVGSMMFFAVFALGIFLDSVAGELIGVSHDMGVDDGVFAPVLSLADGIVWLIVPTLLLGISLWIIWGAVQQERREEQRRRIP